MSFRAKLIVNLEIEASGQEAADDVTTAVEMAIEAAVSKVGRVESCGVHLLECEPDDDDDEGDDDDDVGAGVGGDRPRPRCGGSAAKVEAHA